MKLPLSTTFPIAGQGSHARSLMAFALAGAVLWVPAPASAQSGSENGPAADLAGAVPEASNVAVTGRWLQDASLAFVENRGQWDPKTRFVAKRGPMVARLERDGLVLQLRDDSKALVLKFVFEGASEEVVLEGEDRRPGLRNYFIGNDPEAWHSAVPAFGSVLYRGLYEGIDLRVRDLEGRLEYDLLLAPGADLSACVVRCEGADGVRIDPDGSLVLETEHGPVRQTPPKTWYELPSGERRPVACHFVARGESAYGFEIPERDPELEVVIDPGLEWSTFLGGSNEEQPLAIAWDAATGHVIVAGRTLSDDFPTTFGAYDECSNPTEDAFVACLDPALTGADQLVWSTYLGGNHRDRVMQLALDDGGNVLLVGHTLSDNFPTTSGAYDQTCNGGWDAFVAKLSADGSTLEYSTFLGAAGHDWGLVIAYDGGDTVTVGGNTNSVNFPVTPGAFQPTNAGLIDCFVARLALTGDGLNDLVYSTYLGGSNQEGISNFDGFPIEMRRMAVATDASGCIYVTGCTSSADFPVTPDAYDGSLGGFRDVFLCRIDPAGSGASDLAYSTFLGGSQDECPFGLAVDPSGVMVFGGYTRSNNYPTTPGAFQVGFVGPTKDAFLSWLDPSQPPALQLTYSTFLGTDGSETVGTLVLDGLGGVVADILVNDVGGVNPNFPTTCGAYDRTYNGNEDAALIHLTPNGNGMSDLEYSSYLGRSAEDWFGHMALVDGGAAPRVASVLFTRAIDFPTTEGAFERTFQGWSDAAVVLFELAPGPSVYCVTAPNSAGLGARIGSTGSISIAANDFTLTVADSRPGQFGVFFYGPAQQEVPFGDGFLCVAPGGLIRLNPPILADASGSASRLVDFTQPPAGSGPGMIRANTTTWNFQFWYRDPGGPGGSGFNLSNALSVNFCP